MGDVWTGHMSPWTMQSFGERLWLQLVSINDNPPSVMWIYGPGKPVQLPLNWYGVCNGPAQASW